MTRAAKSAPTWNPDRLRKLAVASGLPGREIARRAGIDPKNLRGILSGSTPNPRIETIIAILAATGRTLADLDG